MRDMSYYRFSDIIIREMHIEGRGNNTAPTYTLCTRAPAQFVKFPPK